jgi:hypothetical protein
MQKEYALTKSMKKAAAMAALLRQAGDAAIGEITGETRVGKSAAGLYIAAQPNSIRICCFQGISPYKLDRALRKALKAAAGYEGDPADYPATLAAEDRPLLVVDEANKATWPTLEILRYLADEAGWAVLLIGTELYTRQFADARTAPLLKQLGDRIGGKRVAMQPMDRAETLVHVLKPRFGTVALTVATSFWHASRKGHWGPAIELADTCRRVMDANGRSVLDAVVLNSALAEMGRAPIAVEQAAAGGDAKEDAA